MIDFSKPVRTKSGRAVRILCTDAPGVMSVIGLASDELLRWTVNGSFYFNRTSDYDLENVPEGTFVYRNVYLIGGKLAGYGSYATSSAADEYAMDDRVGRIEVKLEAHFDD